MKRYMGAILLSVTFYVLPAGQEEVTGSALKNAYTEYVDAIDRMWRSIDAGTENETRYKTCGDVLDLFDEEGMTLDKIKAYLEKEKKKYVEKYKASRERQKTNSDNKTKLQTRADKLIDAAARKIG